MPLRRLALVALSLVILFQRAASTELIGEGEENAEAIRNRRQTSQDFNLWPLNPIPIEFDGPLDDEKRAWVKLGAKIIEEATCVRFTFNATKSIQRIIVRNGTKQCLSAHGMTLGSSQAITLGPGCGFGASTTHEMLHALGFFHTQKRSDRDLYITVNDANINPNNTHDFKKIDVKSYMGLGIPYDFASVMHYFSNAFSMDSAKGPAMQAKDPRYRSSMGGDLPSFYDFLMVNIAYKCFDRCPANKRPNCKNGGVIDVNNCSICYCPRGYSGPLCEDRDPGNGPKPCGSIQLAFHSPRTLNLTIEPFKEQTRGFTHCPFLLKASLYRKVKVTLRDLPNDNHADCDWLGIELRPNVDKRQSGMRFCNKKHENVTIISDTATMIVDPYIWYKQTKGYTFKIDIVSVE